MDYTDCVNPWALFELDDIGVKRIVVNNTIDNRFPNNFRKYSSLVTCNFCNVILLKNQAQQHFKIHHNKKFKKKFSRFKIPFNAVEGYDLICELRRKKLATNNMIHANKTKDLFMLKHKHSESTFVKQTNKAPSKIVKKSQKELKSLKPNEYVSPKTNIVSERSLFKNIELSILDNDENTKVISRPTDDGTRESNTDNRKLGKRELLTSPIVNNRRPKSTDLKLNIRLNSDGLLTSSIKGEAKAESNIFDRISHFCDTSVVNKTVNSQKITPSRGVIKQSGFDESYGCKIFTDEFNNSILIDNDKDEIDDFDCCESSLSNDSAYFSLPNTTTNSVITSSGKSSSNVCDSSVAPPLVTAYQYSNSTTNKVSYSTIDCQPKRQSKTTPMTMHVTRSLSYNSIVPPKSTVKHRFYVSGHSNQNIINTLKRKCNINSDLNYLLENENEESGMEYQTNRILHSLSKESQDSCYFENNKSSYYQNTKYPINSKSCNNDTKDMTENRFWNCFEENGLSVNILIPKRLRWKKSKLRTKSVSQLNIVRSKPSPKNIIPKQQFLRNVAPALVSENPLLTSYTINANTMDDGFQSDPLLTSDIVLDYQVLDRNQMSFQQRLLERGVISQRDIARSQRCLSFSVTGNSRKNGKMNPIKSNTIDYNRLSSNKNYPIKTQVFCRNGYNAAISSSCNLGKIKPTVIHQSTSLIPSDSKINTIRKHMVTHQKPMWCEEVNLSRIPKVSTFQGQCLSQNAKTYITTQDSKITISPCQNRISSMSSLPRTMETGTVDSIFQPTSSNSSILHSNNSPFSSILTAQNTFSNDSNHYSQRQIQGQYVQLPSNNGCRSYKKMGNEFRSYHQSYNDVNAQSIAAQSNYQTMYNPQIKFANHSTTIYNGNFEL